MKRKSYILLGSPRELAERKELANPGNFDFLLINVGGACNHKCFFCWTHDSTYPIINKNFLNNSELTSLVNAFHKAGGDTCAIMSDGEPLFSVNLRITKKLVELTGKFGMNMLLFTNGELLNQQMIKQLTQLNPKISFVVSINASTEKKYDKTHGIKGKFKKVMDNLEAWKKFCKNTNRKTKNNKILTQFAIHSVVFRANLDEIPKMQKLANDMDCALIITAPGISGRASLHEKEIAKNQKDLKFLKKITERYSDTKGPTAKTYSNKCAYISSSHNLNSSHGVTIHSLGGMVLPCPYFVGLGADNWFELKKYLSQDGKDISKWLSTSVQVSSAITDTIFKVFGYNYCIKRHTKYPYIEEFMTELNKIMKEKVVDLNISSPKYFDKLLTILKRVLERLAKKHKQ